MKRAVLYARVSRDDRANDNRNLESQLEMCREYANKNGWKIIFELAEDDRGASGASLDLPQLNKALEMASSGEYDILLTREIDRLARGVAKQLIVEEELKRAGVQIEYVIGEYPDTPEGNLNKQIKAVISEYERLKIAERVTRGRRNKVKAGSVMTYQRPPYGYRQTESDGKYFLEVFEPEAAIVQLIFHLYINGESPESPLSIYAIRNRLNDMQVPTPGSGERKNMHPNPRGEWATSSIHFMLKRETYAGTWHFGKRGKKRNPESHWIPVEVPAIIERSIWEAAQVRLGHNKKYSPRNLKYESEYFMRRRGMCGHCGSFAACRPQRGGTNNKTLYHYYRCSASISGDCTGRYFRSDRVDSIVWAWLCSILMRPDLLKEGWKRYQEVIEERNMPLFNRLEIVEKLLADNHRKHERVLDLYLSDSFDRTLLVERSERLKTTIEKLEEERENLRSKLNATAATKDQINEVSDFVAQVAEGLDLAHADFHVRRWLVERLNVEVAILTEDDKRYVIPSCMLDLPSAKLEVGGSRKGAAKQDMETIADIMSNGQHHQWN